MDAPSDFQPVDVTIHHPRHLLATWHEACHAGAEAEFLSRLGRVVVDLAVRLSDPLPPAYQGGKVSGGLLPDLAIGRSGPEGSLCFYVRVDTPDGHGRVLCNGGLVHRIEQGRHSWTVHT